MMVLSAVAILTFMLAEFTDDTKINRLKVYNQRDTDQARLNAEAGIQFALAKMKIYREARNLLEKNKKTLPISPSDIEQILMQPFIFPIPVDENKMNLIQRNAIAEFTESVLLQGSLTVTMRPISAFLNPNNLIVRPSVPSRETPDENEDEDEEEEDNIPLHVRTREELIKMITEVLREEREANPDYDLLYGDLEAERLVGEMAYFVNTPGRYSDPMAQDFESLYTEREVIPKHGPFTSLDELYLLAGWNDSMVDLIKDRLTVHSTTMAVPINALTEPQLRAVFPDITPIQIEEFFRRRDGDHELGIAPTPFKSRRDFESLITGHLGVVEKGDFDDRMEILEKTGIEFEAAGNLFEVTSTSEVGRGRYTIYAVVYLPEVPPLPPETAPGAANNGQNPVPPRPGEAPPPPPPQEEEENEQKEPDETFFLEPRIVEIKVM